MKDLVVSTLGRASANLNAASDLLTQKIAETESALAELRLGVEAWVDLKTTEVEEEDGPGYELCSELGYAKHKGRWALLVRWGLAGDLPDVSFLADASREGKLEALGKIPSLLDALKAAAEELELKIRAAAVSVPLGEYE